MIKIFTFLSKEKIDSIIEEHRKNPEARLLQKQLAKEITIFVHGNDEFEKAIETTEKLFSKQATPIENMSEDDLQAMEGIVKIEISPEKIKQGIDLISLLAETGITPSKGEARKLLQNGGISLNRNKVQSTETKVDSSLLLHNK